MGAWNLYFLLKLFLYFKGQVVPLWSANLLFALVLAVPLRRRAWRILRQLVALPAGIALLYYEAHVPAFARLIAEFSNIETFTPAYFAELLGRFISPVMAALALVAVVVYALVNRWVRVSTVVVLALVAVPLTEFVAAVSTRSATLAAAPLPGAGRTSGRPGDPGQAGNAGNAGSAGSAGQAVPADFDAALQDFRRREAGRRVTFAPPAQAADSFDIIVLHVCSLAWDDLDVSKTRDLPLLQHVDYLFTDFSSAASYSGPAAIRVLRADCGQSPHDALYKPDPAACHLFGALAQAGYTPQIIMNHDGHFDNFLNLVEENIGVPGLTPLSTAGLPVAMHAFDGSPILSDYDVLARWAQARATVQGPVALYYNTISLHDGNQVKGSKLSSVKSYPARVTQLMADVDRFTDLIARSGRKAVIVFVPEHGAALRGDANQIAGLREVPEPRIVHVPVGVTLVGLPNPGGRQVIDAPTSFLALAQLLSRMVAQSPFAPGAPALAHYADALPETPMVGENEGTIMMRTAHGFAVRSPDNVWVESRP